MKKRFIALFCVVLIVAGGIVFFLISRNHDLQTSTFPSTKGTSVSSITVPVGNHATQNEASTSINIVIGQEVLKAQLFNNSAANDLKRQLPLTLNFRNFASGYEEKIADVDESFSLNGMSDGEDPTPGDIGYWSPQPRIVLYWGDVGYYSGIHRIGRFDDIKRATQIVGEQKEDFEVTISLANEQEEQ
ncbi:MAG: hypothetical protein KIC85_12565 [Enterococcus gilvus]|nr:hypothetical protein [Enterococcus gilvus]